MANNGDIVKCPHCECRVRLSDVENDDGFCPECGQLVMNSTLADTLEEDEEIDEEQFDDDDVFDDDEDDTERDVLDELTDDSFGFDDDDDEDVMELGSGKRSRGGMGNDVAPKKRGRRSHS